MYEHFAHTADLGLRVQAATEEELFADAARGMFAMIIEDLDAITPQQEMTFDIEGADREYLLFDWLNELLFLFETERVLLSEFEVQLRKDGLHATARGELLDRQKHVLSHEVKAITYHHLKIEQAADGWLAEVIVDI